MCESIDMKLFPFLCGTVLWVGCFCAMGDEPAPLPSAKQVIPATSTPDGFTILNDRVYFIRNGQMVPLTQEVTLRISPNGTITSFDGTTYVIPRGQVLTLSAGVAGLSSVTQAEVKTAADQAATGAQQTPAPNLGESPFTRFHRLDAGAQQALNPQLTYPVPNDSPFTRFHQQAAPQESKSTGTQNVPNNAPTGPYK